MLSYFALFACLFAAQFAEVHGIVPLYGQCGGIGYTGDKDCGPRGTCLYWNQYFAQCLPPDFKPSYTSISVPTCTTTRRVATNPGGDHTLTVGPTTTDWI